MPKKLKVILIVIAVLIEVAMIVSCSVMCHKPSRKEWANTIEQFYNNNKATLNEFVDICCEYDISLIEEYGNGGSYKGEYTLINDYCVYSNEEIGVDETKRLEKAFELFKEFEVYIIHGSNRKYDGISFGTGGLSYSVSLNYIVNEISIDEIKEANFYRVVKYIDDNWYIGYGE